MSLTINTNLPALTALNNLSMTNTQMDTSIMRLSTGLRINSAADDPAGLIISQNFQAQMKGTVQAISNSQDAINMSKTADGALSEVSTLILNMRALAVDSANTAVVDANTLQANQTQIQSTIESINRIANQTQFGSKKLLDGSAGDLANVTDANDVGSIYMGSNFGTGTAQTGPITIARVNPATQAIITMGKGFATSTAVVTTTGSFVINGYSITSSGTDTVSSLVGKINAISSTTGVTAQISGNAPATVVLTNTNYGSQYNVSYFDPSGILNNAASASSTGTDAVFNVTMTTNSGLQTVPFTGGRGAGDSGLKLTDNYGNQIMITQQGNAAATVATQVGVLTSGSVQFQIGANSNQSVSFSMPVVLANKLGTGAVPGKSLADIDVTTPQGAQDAMKIIDDATTQVAELRGKLGAFQSDVLQSSVRTLNVANQNLTASESQVTDADMATEITNFTRLQILNQSGMSVLAQANQQPQNILALLKGG